MEAITVQCSDCGERAPVVPVVSSAEAYAERLRLMTEAALDREADRIAGLMRDLSRRGGQVVAEHRRREGRRRPCAS